MITTKHVKLLFVLTASLLINCKLTAAPAIQVNEQQKISPPELKNNPQFDMILTNRKPILSANNPSPCPAKFTMDFEISMNPDFPADKTISYDSVVNNYR